MASRKGASQRWAAAIAAASGLLACGSEIHLEKPISASPNVVLIVLDTTRADHLPCYGYRRNTTPAICGLAEDGALFERAYSQAPCTRPSVASLFTSLHVSRHLTVTNDHESGDVLDESLVTLAEVLRANGYYTKGIVSNAHVKPSYGFGQGFDSYTPDGKAGYASALTDQALDFLEGEAQRRAPFFLYLHYIDPHSPYLVPWADGDTCEFEIDGEQMSNRSQVFRVSRKLRRALREDAELRASFQCVVPFYDGDLRDTDQAIARVLTAIEERGFSEETLIIVTADHGEEFGDHGTALHCHSLYDELIRVPLLVRPPGGSAAHRIADAVRLVDIMPTILDFLGFEFDAPYALEGETFMPMIRGVARHDSTSVISENLPRQRAVIHRGWKLVQSGKRAELYNLEIDPRELSDLATARPQMVERLRGFLEDLDGRPDLLDGPTRLRLDEETRRDLQDLGYLEEDDSPG